MLCARCQYILRSSVYPFVPIAVTRFAIGHVPYFLALRKQMRQGTITPMATMAEYAVFIFWMLSAAAVMARIEKRHVTDYGIPLRARSAMLFAQGTLFGLVQVAIAILIIYKLGGFSFGTLALGGWTGVRYACEWALAFTLVGFAEEFLFRGYPLYTLAKGIGFWPAAILLGIIFGATHLFNPGENWAGAIDIVVFALVASFMLLRIELVVPDWVPCCG